MRKPCATSCSKVESICALLGCASTRRKFLFADRRTLKDYFDLFLWKAKRRADADYELKKMMEDEAAN